MPFRLLLSLILTLALSLFASSNASASLVLSYSPSSPDPLTAGGVGTVDVFVRTDAGNQSFDGFQLQVGLTPTSGSPVGGLVFSNLQLDAQLGVGGANGYVFFGNSLSQVTGSPVGTVSPTGSLFTGFDATNNLNPVVVTTTNRLVYRLNLTAVNAGTYNMTANVLPSSFFTNQLDPTNTTIPFTSDTLSLNVTAVPEPSSIALLSFGVLAAGARRLNRRLRKAQA